MTTIYEALARRLREIRKGHELSPERVEQETGVKCKALGTYESLNPRTHRRPDLDTLRKLAEYYEIRPWYLILREQTIDTGEFVKISGLSSAYQRKIREDVAFYRAQTEKESTLAPEEKGA